MNDPTPTGNPAIEAMSPDPSSGMLPGDAVAIDVRDLNHSFKNHQALHQVNFQVMPRSLHGFVGPNGAGKTTALNAAAEAATGEVLVFTDATTEFTTETLRTLVEPLADPTVG